MHKKVSSTQAKRARYVALRVTRMHRTYEDDTIKIIAFSFRCGDHYEHVAIRTARSPATRKVRLSRKIHAASKVPSLRDESAVCRPRRRNPDRMGIAVFALRERVSHRRLLRVALAKHLTRTCERERFINGVFYTTSNLEPPRPGA